MSKIDHPTHYNEHPSGVECITITEAYNFNVGNAIKYLWRAGLKGAVSEDLEKAAWYVQRELERVAAERMQTQAKLKELTRLSQEYGKYVFSANIEDDRCRAQKYQDESECTGCTIPSCVKVGDE